MKEMEKEMLLNRVADVLTDIKRTCVLQQDCFTCPFCRYTVETARKKDYYSASKLCSLIRTFCLIPRDIDLERFNAFITEGQK